MTAHAGPLCEEPLWGVAIILEWLEVLAPPPLPPPPKEDEEREEGGTSQAAGAGVTLSPEP